MWNNVKEKKDYTVMVPMPISSLVVNSVRELQGAEKVTEANVSIPSLTLIKSLLLIKTKPAKQLWNKTKVLVSIL